MTAIVDREEGLVRLYHHMPTWLLRQQIADKQHTAFGPVPAKYASYLAAERAEATWKIELMRVELWARGDESMFPPTDPIERATYERMFKNIWRGDSAEDRVKRRQRIAEEIDRYAAAGDTEHLVEAQWCLALLDQVIAEVARESAR